MTISSLVLVMLWHQLQLVSAVATATATKNSSGMMQQEEEEQDLWTTYFRRGSANVQWCEDVVASHAHDDWVAEYYNTWSNLAFCFVALVGLQRCWMDRSLNWSFWTTEIVMMAIGIGSIFFHAHQSRFSQISDELPMILLLLTSSHCLENLHPSTTLQKGQKFRSYYLLNHSFVLLYWALYSYLDIYEIFLNGFGIQMTALFALGFDAGRRIKKQRPQWKWYCSFVTLLIAKGLWEFERYRYRNNSCDAPGTLWLHPLWHLGAAASHVIMMSNYADLNHHVKTD